MYARYLEPCKVVELRVIHGTVRAAPPPPPQFICEKLCSKWGKSLRSAGFKIPIKISVGKSLFEIFVINKYLHHSIKIHTTAQDVQTPY